MIPGILKKYQKREILAGILIGVTTGWICFRHPLGMIAGLALFPFYLRYAFAGRVKKRKQNLEREFKDVMAILYSSCAAGNTIEKACRDCLIQMREEKDRYEIFYPEFLKIINGLQRNRPFDELITEMADRLEHEEVLQFVQIIRVAKRSGGSIADIIQTSMNTLSLRMEINNEIDVILSGKKGEFGVMLLVPPGILLYMSLCSGDYMDVLYTTLAGRAVMIAAIGIFIVAVIIGNKILEIKV